MEYPGASQQKVGNNSILLLLTMPSRSCREAALTNVAIGSPLLIPLLSFRLYEAAEEDSLPDILKNFLQFLRSEALFLLLSNFTGLKLHFLAPSDEDEDAGEGRAADSAGHSSPKPRQDGTEQHADGSAHQPDQPDDIPEAQDSETQNGKWSSSSTKGLEQNPDFKGFSSRIPRDSHGSRISPAASAGHKHGIWSMSDGVSKKKPTIAEEFGLK